jgi:hypothetical protein
MRLGIPGARSSFQLPAREAAVPDAFAAAARARHSGLSFTIMRMGSTRSAGAAASKKSARQPQIGTTMAAASAAIR